MVPVRSPAAACTADARARGPTSSRAARCPKPDAWFSGSRPVSPAVGPAPTVPGTSSLVPSGAKNGPARAPAAPRPPGTLPHRSLVMELQGSKAAAQPEPPQATPACSVRQHRPRGSAVSLGESAGVPSPPGVLTAWGVRHAPSDPRLHPLWGRNAIFKARAAEQGWNTSAHTTILATPRFLALTTDH
ncbi:hypothetical protein NDU88_001044 [Pleurodeles waltl]|uniref:Uncharacterized protein n=1 Tax=Pleurodeles waltl TaxID=8319 RepID=A0AAV7R8K8_PLEWA|nr:hypothetical protein NDU88_001044 [Pleurodeles waltl]